jgi:CheY-like chemotaxis protein
VDDNRELYKEAFSCAGFDVDDATNGEEAIRKALASSPDAVIMDLAMPDVDGWEATRRIKSEAATQGLKVIVVTGHATALGLERARDAGADDVCAKPCLPHDLVALVRKHLEA